MYLATWNASTMDLAALFTTTNGTLLMVPSKKKLSQIDQDSPAETNGSDRVKGVENRAQTRCFLRRLSWRPLLQKPCVLIRIVVAGLPPHNHVCVVDVQGADYHSKLD